MRTCYICHCEKPLDEFGKDRSKHQGHDYKCKVCASAKDKGKRKTRNDFRYTHERFPAEFAAFTIAQKGHCAICDRKKELVLDHCHKTDRARGLLCRRCNGMLGFYRDDPATFRKAAAYLENTPPLQD